MKNKIIAASILLVAGMLFMASNPGIAGYNAAPGQNANACASSGCHTGNALNSGGGSVTITDNIPATGYIPGATYQVSVTVAKTGVGKFGFGFEAVTIANNSNAGSLQVTNSSLTRTLSSTRVNMTHLTNSGLGTSAKTFSFNWIAPAVPNGSVTFYAAGNAANGNNSDTGDFIYTTTRTFGPAPLVTGSINTNPLCGNSSGIAIPYTAGGTYVAGNIFTAQLSDALGSFANPTALGSVTATASGTITTTVPLPNIAGSAYRIRVVSSAPTYTAPDNGTNLSIQAAPSAANAGVNQSVCGTSATMAANAPAVGTGSWTVISGSATFASAANPSTAVSGLTAGTNVLRWTITNGTCAGSVSDVTITAALPPSTASAGINQTICAGTAVMNANTPVNGNGTWSIVSGSATIVNPSSATTAISNVSTGTTVLMWTINNGVCAASTSTMALVYTGSITVANAGADQTVCATSATLNANTAVNGAGTWSLISGSGTFGSAGNPSTTLTGLGAGNNVFRWIISNGACNPSTDDVVIRSVTISPAQTITSFTTCGTNAVLTATAPVNGTGAWSVLTGSASLSNASSTSCTAVGLSAGPNAFLWTVSNAPCVSNTATVNVVQSGTITDADAGTDQSICGYTTNMNAQPVYFGTSNWSVLSGSGIFASANSPNTAVTGLAQGTNVFRITITNGTCTPVFDDIIVNTTTISTANAGANQVICSSITTLVASTPLFGTGTWSLQSGAGSIFSPSSAVTPVIALGNGINVFRYTITNAPCPNSVSDMTVSNCVNNGITTGTISGSPFCSNSSYAVQVNFNSTGVFPGYFSAQLSDASGNFNNAVTIGSGTASPIYATIPPTTPAGTGYRIRVVNSQPSTVGNNNGSDLSINTCAIDYVVLDTVASGPYCDYTSYDVSVSFVTGGDAPPPYKIQLSNVNGSFISPLTIGYGYSSPIIATIPFGVPASTNYRVRVQSANLNVASNDSPKPLVINVCLEAGITTTGYGASLRFFPTQLENELHVSGAEGQPLHLKLTDITGRLIIEKHFDSNIGTLDVSNLNSQLYFVNLQSGSQSINGIVTKK